MKTPDIIKAASQGEAFALAAINKLARYFGIALASIVPVLAPQKVCVAGGVSEAGDTLLDATRESFLSYAGPSYAEGVIIQKAFLGWQSVLVGAAVAFRREPH
jgi:glucokinase